MISATNIAPLCAVVLAQYAPPESGLQVYGPIGIICLWLMWRDERTRKESARIHDGTRVDNEKLREEFRGFTHQLKGLNRNMLYVVATHGPEGLRQVASKELERQNEGA